MRSGDDDPESQGCQSAARRVEPNGSGKMEQAIKVALDLA